MTGLFIVGQGTSRGLTVASEGGLSVGMYADGARFDIRLLHASMQSGVVDCTSSHIQLELPTDKSTMSRDVTFEQNNYQNIRQLREQYMRVSLNVYWLMEAAKIVIFLVL